MSLPSITRSSGTSPPASLVSVGSRSMPVMASSDSVPAGIVPGQRATNGTRTPPSRVEPLPPFNGPALPPVPVLGPLSDVKMTSVFLSSPSSFRDRRISPVLQSSS